MKEAQSSKLKAQSHKSKLKILTFLILICSLSYAEPEKSSIAQVERSFLEGKYEKAISNADILINSRSSQRDSILYLKGLSQLKLNRFKESRNTFEEIVARYANSRMAFDAHLGIGDSYFLEGDANKAIDVYKEMLERYPNDKNIALIYYRLGDCYKNIGSNDKANEYLNKAKKASPLSFESRMTSIPNLRAMPQAESAGYYSVQVGCFKNKRNAERFTSKLLKEGYEAFIEMPAGSDDKLYRVKVGRFKTEGESDILASRLKRAGYNIKVCN